MPGESHGQRSLAGLQSIGLRRKESDTTEPLTLVHSAIKKRDVMPFAAAWMGLEVVILNEVRQKEKGKYRVISLMCRI